MSTRGSLIAFVCLFGSSIAPASAVPIAPGGGATLVGTTAASDHALVGATTDTTTAWFTPLISLGAGPSVTGAGGTVTSRVTLSADTGHTIFGSSIHLDYNTSDFQQFWITGFELTGYAGWSTDVDFRLEDGGAFPSIVSRSADGDKLLFTLIDGGPSMLIGPSTTSAGLFSAFPSIVTDAEGSTNTGTLRIIGFRTTDAEFATSILISGVAVPYYREMPSAVPLPAAGLGLITAVGGLIALSRRRSV